MKCNQKRLDHTLKSKIMILYVVTVEYVLWNVVCSMSEKREPFNRKERPPTSRIDWNVFIRMCRTKNKQNIFGPCMYTWPLDERLYKSNFKFSERNIFCQARPCIGHPIRRGFRIHRVNKKHCAILRIRMIGTINFYLTIKY